MVADRSKEMPTGEGKSWTPSRLESLALVLVLIVRGGGGGRLRGVNLNPAWEGGGRGGEKSGGGGKVIRGGEG